MRDAMKKYKNILVMKFDYEKEDLATALSLREQTAQVLEEDFHTLIVPNTWEVKFITQVTIYIKMDASIDSGISSKIFEQNKKFLGDEYQMVANLLDAEVIR